MAKSNFVYSTQIPSEVIDSYRKWSKAFDAARENPTSEAKQLRSRVLYNSFADECENAGYNALNVIDQIN